MVYLTRLGYFTFEKEGDELVITSERDSSFEERHKWDESWSVTDVDLASNLHEQYYTDLVTDSE